jgi:5-methylcytosine-specific restriction endonuclease McrA
MPERNTTIRDRHRRTIARTKPPCGICGNEIDYTLRYPDLMAYVVDHIIPVYHGGTDDLQNKQAAHNKCNREKWHHVEGDATPVTFVTARAW